VIHEEGVGGFLHRGATTFPQGLGLAATWNTSLMAEVAEVIRTQMLAVGARHNLSPVLDVARDPRWGRVEETYGESPELCCQMGVAYVKAMQTDDLANGVVCTGKHFLGYTYRWVGATMRQSISVAGSCARSTQSPSRPRSERRASLR